MNALKTILLLASITLIPTISMAADAPVPAKVETPVVQQTTPPVSKPTKIGSIDLNYIGMESELGKSVKAALNEKKSTLQARIVAENKKLETLKSTIEAKLPTYTPKQREAKSKEFQKKVEAFQKLARDSEESFMKEQENETNRVYTFIEKTVSDYGKANDFAIIVSKKDILYSDSSNEPQDLTSIILKAVNDAWKKK